MLKRLWSDHRNACLLTLALLVIGVVVSPWVLLAAVLPVGWVLVKRKGSQDHKPLHINESSEAINPIEAMLNEGSPSFNEFSDLESDITLPGFENMDAESISVLEPFAGAGNLFDFIDTAWVGYDIDPQHFNVEIRDTIKDFPTDYQVCITNPPYLAKTIISRKRLPVIVKHEDLYLDCLQLMLDNCDYVAAIIH